MGSFAANGDRLALDVTVGVEGSKSLGALGNLATGASTPLLKELPGDTWGAFGAPQYGKSLRLHVRPVRRRRSAAPRSRTSCASSTGSTSTTTC